jgi:serine/threonine protein kinase
MRLFALAIYCDVSLPDIDILITNYEDSDLPFPLHHQLGKGGKLAGSVFETIRNTQSRFLAAELREREYRDDFTDRPIPIEFTPGSKPDIGEGSGGRVYKAKIHKSHFPSLKEVQYSRDWSEELALKVSKFKRDAERERDFLESLAKHHPHKHITTFYTGFVCDEKIYLVAELADGDLDGFMKGYLGHKAVRDLDREWLLSQLTGLADALATIHDIMIYHVHDIKPANILVFNNLSTGVKHRLKFTDFGSASGQKSDMTGGSVGTKIKGTTPTLPPETHLNGLSSRPHDVWSLGCVFLDILIWYHEGWDTLNGFRSRVMEGSNAWCYYDVKDGNKMLTGLVSTTLDEYARTEARLVSVIREMLEIDPGSRLKIAKVVQILSTID